MPHEFRGPHEPDGRVGGRLCPREPPIRSYCLSAAPPLNVEVRFDLSCCEVWWKRGGIGDGTPSWTADGAWTRHSSAASSSGPPGGTRGDGAAGSRLAGPAPPALGPRD